MRVMKTYKDILVLVAVSLTLVFIWFHKGFIFAGGEEEIPFYDLERTFSIYYHTWRDSDLGFPNIEQVTRVPFFYILKILSAYGLSNVFLQASTFFILLFLGAISIYFLLRFTLPEIQKEKNLYVYVPLVGAIFYILNPYSMAQVWGRGLYIQFFPFALFPFFLLCLHLTFVKNSFPFLILGLLSTYLLSGSFGNISYLFTFWMMIVLYLLVYIYKHRSKREAFFAVSVFLFLAVSFFALHSWWLLHDKVVLSSSLDNRAANPEQNLGTLRGVSWSVPFVDSIRLLHNYILKDNNYTKVYHSIPFFFLSILPPIAFLFSIKKIKRMKYGMFLTSLFLLTLFFVLGSNFPTGFLFELLFKSIYPLQAYRNPYEKMGILFTIAYVPFFAYGLCAFSEYCVQKVKRTQINQLKLTALLIFLYCGVFVWPMWTGQFAGGINFNPWVEVPSYYKDADLWLNSQSGDFRILHVPLIPGDGTKYTWEHSYQGTDPSEHLFTKSSISRNVNFNLPYYAHLLKQFETPNYIVPEDVVSNDFAKNTLIDQLRLLSVRYVILHTDVDTQLSGAQTIVETQRIIENNSLKKVNTFGKLEIYEVVNSLPIIHTNSSTLSFIKYRPGDYRLQKIEEKTKIFLTESYSPFWEIKNDGANSTHTKAYSFANSWDLDNMDKETTIHYTPQKYVDTGLEVSFYVLGVLLLLAILFYRKIYYEKK